MRLALLVHPGPFSETSESSTDSGCSPLRIGADSLRMLCDVKRFQFDLSYDAVIAAGESHARFFFFDEFKSSELNWTRSRYSFSSEKLVILENDPLSIHWRTA